MKKTDTARDKCRQGSHADPDNYGMCVYCNVILDPEPGEEPNYLRREYGWDDVPVSPDAVGEWMGRERQP